MCTNMEQCLIYLWLSTLPVRNDIDERIYTSTSVLLRLTTTPQCGAGRLIADRDRDDVSGWAPTGR